MHPVVDQAAVAVVRPYPAAVMVELVELDLQDMYYFAGYPLPNGL